MDHALKELSELYRDMSPTLLAYFRRQSSIAGSAEDLLQETFVRAMRGFGRLRASVSPKAYLFGIARHVSLDALRALRPTEELSEDTAAPTVDSEDARLESMRAAIEALSAPHREALLLKLRHELSYEEIAEVLGVPVGTVRSRLHHAVRQLREALNPERPVSSE